MTSARPRAVSIGALVVLVTATVLLDSRRDAFAAEASPCDPGERPWVEIRAGGDLPPALETFVELLRAELASRGFALCPSGDEPRPAPVASVEVTPRANAVSLGIEVRDAVTAKRVGRDVDLSAMPPDGRPLALALAADELLRASWAELALRDASPPAMPVPAAVTQTVRDTVVQAPSAATPHLELGVAAAWEHFGHGTTLYGADARIGVWVMRRIEAQVRFGVRAGPSAMAADGAVQPSAWSTGLAAAIALGPLPARWGLDAIAGVDLEHVTYVPTPRAPATATSASDFALLAGLGPRGWFAILPTLRAGLELLAAVPLRGVDATDARARVTGIAGPGWVAQIGLSSLF